MLVTSRNEIVLAFPNLNRVAESWGIGGVFCARKVYCCIFPRDLRVTTVHSILSDCHDLPSTYLLVHSRIPRLRPSRYSNEMLACTGNVGPQAGVHYHAFSCLDSVLGPLWHGANSSGAHGAPLGCCFATCLAGRQSATAEAKIVYQGLTSLCPC